MTCTWLSVRHGEGLRRSPRRARAPAARWRCRRRFWLGVERLHVLVGLLPPSCSSTMWSIGRWRAGARGRERLSPPKGRPVGVGVVRRPAHRAAASCRPGPRCGRGCCHSAVRRALVPPICSTACSAHAGDSLVDAARAFGPCCPAGERIELESASGLRPARPRRRPRPSGVTVEGRAVRDRSASTSMRVAAGADAGVGVVGARQHRPRCRVQGLRRTCRRRASRNPPRGRPRPRAADTRDPDPRGPACRCAAGRAAARCARARARSGGGRSRVCGWY